MFNTSISSTYWFLCFIVFTFSLFLFFWFYFIISRHCAAIASVLFGIVADVGAVATDETGKILIAIGVRQIQPVPAWLLSWALSDLSSYQFARVWRQCIDFLCSYFEGIDVNEFYVLNPEDREESYRRIMKFLRDRYWTFVETTIAPGSRTNHSLYNAFMGHTTYPYQVHIRRYIKKREHHD